MNISYRIIRSANRKRLSLEINEDGLTVRAPKRASDREIKLFIMNNEEWILKHLEKYEEKKDKYAEVSKLSNEELSNLADQAMKYIPERVKYYAPLIGVSYGRITIRNQRTRWGSCSSKGNLNFNCLLMLTPPEVIDYVVVHELCHRKEMNHSKKFYDEIEKVYPEYKTWKKWLKDNGDIIMHRM